MTSRTLRADVQYAELHCLSNFSFLRGASHPAELVTAAAALGYAGLALTDECSVAGVVRAHGAAKKAGLKLVVGSEIVLADGPKVVGLAVDRQSYGALCRLITARGARRRRARISRAARTSSARPRNRVARSSGYRTSIAPSARRCARTAVGSRSCFRRPRLARGRASARRQRPAAARGMASRRARARPAAGRGGRRADARARAADAARHADRDPSQDPARQARLRSSRRTRERCLAAREELARRYPPELLRETLAIVERVDFSLDELRYEYPDELVPDGETPASHLRKLTEARRTLALAGRRAAGSARAHRARAGADRRAALRALLPHRPRHRARSRAARASCARAAARRRIPPSATASASPRSIRRACDVLFERFISQASATSRPTSTSTSSTSGARKSSSTSTRSTAATAPRSRRRVITYRPRSAMRDVGKALGLDARAVDRLAQAHRAGGTAARSREAYRRSRVRSGEPACSQHASSSSTTLIGFPRHLSQHVGGFVIARGRSSSWCRSRTRRWPTARVIQWDKDDLDALGLLKVDVLALGMLSAIRRALRSDRDCGSAARRFAMQRRSRAEDPRRLRHDLRAPTRSACSRSRSRAQMSMLPRLQAARVLRPRHRGRDRAARARSRAAWCIRTCAGAQGLEPVDLSERGGAARCSSARSACRSSRSR